ncbi:MAG: alpha/beta fold hydrolase, partial [Propionibacteriaceae bacterium]|nr:alpha/beta fold hydrolase [Propionibacteriaceae bacterium]
PAKPETQTRAAPAPSVRTKTGRSAHRVRRRWPIIVVAVVVVVVLGLVAAVFFGQRSLIYAPDRADPGTLLSHGVPGKDIDLTTQDGLTLHAWLLTPTQDNRNEAVLFLPGNGGNRGNRLGIGGALAAQGFTVLLLDYRGYGGNPGSPSQAGLALDAKAAAAYLVSAGFTPQRTLYVGESLGTAVAVQLATTNPPAGLVLRSPFTDMADVAHANYPWLSVGLLNHVLRDKYDTLAMLTQVNVPITVLSGSADTIVPASESATVAGHATDLFQAIVRDGVGHNDILWSGSYVADRVAALANAVIK